MTRKNRKRLVIDANIAYSAGTSEVPSSFYSRVCLDVILRDEHIAVFNRVLRQEWKNHASVHARRWQVAMEQRRRIEDAEGDEFKDLLDRACARLEGATWENALRKDFHLVQSALATDRILLSNESRLPSHLKASCETVPELRKLFFANPQREQDVCIRWIKAGARRETHRRIDQWSRHHTTN